MIPIFYGLHVRYIYNVHVHVSTHEPKPEIVPVFLAFRMPKSIVTRPPPLDGMLVHHRVIPISVCCQYPLIYTPGWRPQRQSGIKFLVKKTMRQMGEAWTLDLQIHSATRAPPWPTGTAINYLCPLCSPLDLWQLFRSSLVSPLLYFSYDKCMAK